MQEINELIEKKSKKPDDHDPDAENDPGGGSGKKNKGRLGNKAKLHNLHSLNKKQH